MLIKEYLEKNLIKFPANSHPGITQLTKKILEEFGEIEIITKKAEKPKNLSVICTGPLEIQVLIPKKAELRPLSLSVRPYKNTLPQENAILSVSIWENITTFTKHPPKSLPVYYGLRRNRGCSVKFIPISDSKL